jgi:hypothetical protein
MPDVRVAAHVTTMIQRCLVEGCPKEIQAAFSGDSSCLISSAKSNRKGAVTAMSVHPECDIILSVWAQSGHSTGLSIE